MKLTDQREAYKAFFVNNENGKAFFRQAQEVMEGNLTKAMSANSLDYLSRAKGNREVLDLIDNVLKTEVSKK